LSRLAAFGFNPPAFFVIHAEAFVDDAACAGLGDAVARLGAAGRGWARLGAGPFAVRSSARQEDGADYSHAGQFDTFPNAPASDVWQAA